jgi:hypothetical protein
MAPTAIPNSSRRASPTHRFSARWYGEFATDATRVSNPGRNHLGDTTATDVSIPIEGGDRYSGYAAVHLHSPSPTRRTMRFTADIDGTAIDRFRSLEPDRVPIPAIHQRDDGDWYVTVAHLETVVTALLADGLSVSVTPVIEARDLHTDVRPADAPPLPWHTD